MTIQDVDRRFDEFSAAGLAEVFEAHYVFLDKKITIPKNYEQKVITYRQESTKRCGHFLGVARKCNPVGGKCSCACARF